MSVLYKRLHLGTPYFSFCVLGHNIYLDSHQPSSFMIETTSKSRMESHIPMQSNISRSVSGNQSKLNPTDHSEKASQAAQSNPPVQESRESALIHFWRSSTFDKLWHLTQTPALLSCFLVVIGSSCAYFMSDYVNCDGRSPYSQAFLSGLYAMLLSMNAYLCAHHLREAGKELDSSSTLSSQARQTRRQRIPILLSGLALGQYLAAVTAGLAAYRTSRAPLDVGFVSMAAFVGM